MKHSHRPFTGRTLVPVAEPLGTPEAQRKQAIRRRSAAIRSAREAGAPADLGHGGARGGRTSIAAHRGRGSRGPRNGTRAVPAVPADPGNEVGHQMLTETVERRGSNSKSYPVQ